MSSDQSRIDLDPAESKPVWVTPVLEIVSISETENTGPGVVADSSLGTFAAS